VHLSQFLLVLPLVYSACIPACVSCLYSCLHSCLCIPACRRSADATLGRPFKQCYQEDRWMRPGLHLPAITSALMLSVLSAIVFGSLMGFLVRFLLYRMYALIGFGITGRVNKAPRLIAPLLLRTILSPLGDMLKTSDLAETRLCSVRDGCHSRRSSFQRSVFADEAGRHSCKLRSFRMIVTCYQGPAADAMR
jgi:hypothetical protein